MKRKKVKKARTKGEGVPLIGTINFSTGRVKAKAGKGNRKILRAFIKAFSN